MHYEYRTRGTCSTRIDFDIEDGIVRNVTYTGGCNGNLQGISRLAVGMPAKELADKLRGIRCGMKETSCPDQLAKALDRALFCFLSRPQPDPFLSPQPECCIRKNRGAADTELRFSPRNHAAPVRFMVQLAGSQRGPYSFASPPFDGFANCSV